MNIYVYIFNYIYIYIYIIYIYIYICIYIYIQIFNCHKSFTLFLCINITTTTRWSEICNLTHLWRSSLFWNVRCIKPGMLLKMSSFTSIFQAFWPQMHLNLARRDFWSPALFKPFYVTFEKFVLFAQKFGINHITFSW